MPSPDHEALVATLIAAGPRTPSVAPTAEAFAASRATESASVPPTPTDLAVQDQVIGGVPCLVVEPRAGGAMGTVVEPRAGGAMGTVVEPRGGGVGTVVYLHGGGYIWMTARTHLAVAAALARTSACRCVSVDYRRAPEHPFPAPVEDLVAVYRALVADGTAPEQIALVGDSAGGGLVLCGLVSLRDRGDRLPAAAVCISPWTDLAVTGSSADTVDDPIVDGAGLRMMASVYLAGADPTTPLASPLYADLTGLPPLLVQVGTREALLDDARRIVERARAAGVDVTAHEFEDVIHMWVVMGPELPESIDAFVEAGAFIRARTGRSAG